MKAEIGEKLFEEILAKCQEELGIPKRKHAVKNPAVISTVIERAQEQGKTCKTLETVVSSILQLSGAAAENKVPE